MQPETIQSMVLHDTYSIERSFSAAPSRVFLAFADPAAKRRWFGGQKEIEEVSLDFRVGGREVLRSRIQGGPLAGAAMQNDTVYLDIERDRRIVFAYTMTIGERHISASLATVELAPTAGGTRLTFTEQIAFFEGADGRERREAGWRSLLDRLTEELRSR
jgi:uncharacterized protein YndB with AHSA1/START domain